MSWSWSHTDEAYSNAETNLRNLPHGDLVEIASEWCAYGQGQLDDPDAHEPFDEQTYHEAVRRFTDLESEDLTDLIWNSASDLATCDNGGFNAWVCPYGCHTVSFDLEGSTHDS